MTSARVVSTLAVAAVLSGCVTTSQPGEPSIVDRLKQRQQDYCAETSPILRAASLAVIRSKVPGYPVSGLCTDAEQALADEVARRMAELPEGKTIDFDQAVEDQRRYKEQQENKQE